MSNSFTRRRAARRGMTLIELSIAMGVGSVIFGLTVTLFASVLRSERSARGHLAETNTIGRLAAQFRRDAHEARSAEVTNIGEPAAKTLRLAGSAGSQVEYRWVEGGLRRTRTQADQPPQRETFLLPSVASINIEIDESDNTQCVALQLEARPAESRRRSNRNLRIESRIGDG